MPRSGKRMPSHWRTAVPATALPAREGITLMAPYCAYFREPEGNKFLVYRKGPDEA